jgi:tetratricopeptide (TPR) repeat protein
MKSGNLRADSPALTRRATFAAVGAMILFGFWIYAPAMNGNWVWDDVLLISHNSAVQDPAGFWKIWLAPAQVDYFPLFTTADWALWQIFGDHAFYFHLVNVALHLGCGFLLWRLLAQLGVRLAWLGGLLWVVHPLGVESVAQASELKNTLAQFFALLSLVAYVAWSDTGGRGSNAAPVGSTKRPAQALYVASLLFFIAAMLSKTSVVMLPFVLLIYYWWKHGRLERASIKATLPFFAASLVLGLITVWFQSYRGIGDEYVPAGGVATRVARAGLALGYYLYECVVPVNLMPMNPRWQVDPPTLAQFLPWPALAALLAALWMKRATWGRHILLGLGFFLLNLVPVLGFVPMAYLWITWTADHFVYLSLLGIVGLAAAGADAAWSRWPKFRPVFAMTGAVVVGLLAWSAHGYDAAFHDDEALFTRAVQANPDAWVAHRSLAQLYQHNGRAHEAKAHFDAAMQIQRDRIAAHPSDAVAHFQLGLLMHDQGLDNYAYAEFQEPLDLKPDYISAHANLGNIMFLSGRIEDAKEQFATALRLGNNSAAIRYDLGYILFLEGHYDQAVPDLQQAIALQPDYAEAHYSLAQSYAKLNRPTDALREYGETLRLRPDNVALRNLVASLKQSPVGNSPAAPAKTP